MKRLLRLFTGESQLKGTLDSVAHGSVFGWAWDSCRDTPVQVEVLVDGTMVARGKAENHRADLESAGIRGGHAAFAIALPPELCDSGFHQVTVRERGSRRELAGSPRLLQLLAPLTPNEFKAGGTWLDGNDETFEARLAELRQRLEIDTVLESQLREFRAKGYVVLPQAIEAELLDTLQADVARVWHERPRLLVQTPGQPAPSDLRDVVQAAEFRKLSVRYLDIHNLSQAAAKILCHDAVSRFISVYFGEPIIAMQSLLFENGTEQEGHQDFPYVHSLRPACVAGAWVALEDVAPEAGPLFYYPGSHRLIEPYQFPNGTVLAQGYDPHIPQYQAYLAEECRRLGLPREIFCARRGDVLLWHSRLVHGGSARINPALTRLSMVSHYTTRSAYPIDRRAPALKPAPIESGSCCYYAWQMENHVEGAYKFPR